MLRMFKEEPFIIMIFIVCSTSVFIKLIFGNINEPDDKKIELNDKTISIKFDSKENDKFIYKDEIGNEYIIKNDKIIGYRNINIFDNSEDKNQIKKSDLPKLLGIKFDKYVLDKENNIYNKYIKGIKTSDSIYVTLDSEEVITRVETNKTGIFNRLLLKTDKEDIEKYVENEMKDKYKIEKYNIKEMTIDYKNKKYIVNCIVEGENTDLIEIVYYL